MKAPGNISAKEFIVPNGPKVIGLMVGSGTVAMVVPLMVPASASPKGPKTLASTVAVVGTPPKVSLSPNTTNDPPFFTKSTKACCSAKDKGVMAVQQSLPQVWLQAAARFGGSRFGRGRRGGTGLANRHRATEEHLLNKEPSGSGNVADWLKTVQRLRNTRGHST